MIKMKVEMLKDIKMILINKIKRCIFSL